METLNDKEKVQMDRREHKRHSVPAMITCTFYEGGDKRENQDSRDLFRIFPAAGSRLK